MDVAVVPETELTRRQARALCDLWATVFPREGRTGEVEFAEWEKAGPPRDATCLNYVVWDPSTPVEQPVVLAVARTFAVEVETAQGSLRVLALAGVGTRPDRERRGLGRTVVTRSFARVDDGSFRLALFQTGVPGFYQKLGCTEVFNAFVNSAAEDPTATPWWDKHVMVYAPRRGWVEGQVDLTRAGW